MINVSNAYKELVKSNIRPKCEPIIKVSGKDNNENDIELIWQAKNIKDLKYKRSIDPIGRELPYMELTWTEIYTGKLNAESYPEKYNNIIKYMKVELSFVQDLGFYNTWKTIFNAGITWKDLFSKSTTWKKIKNGVSQETITMPVMFLSARPTLNGQTITWVAKDFLGFLDSPVLKDINPYSLEIPFFGTIAQVILDSANKYYANIQTIYDALLLSRSNMSQYINNMDYVLKKRAIADNIDLKNYILNYLSLKNYHLFFNLDGSFSFKEAEFGISKRDFRKRDMFNYPIMKKNTDISAYDFKHYAVEYDRDKNYQKSYSEFVEAYGYYIFRFNKYGAALKEYNPNNNSLAYELTFAISDSPSDIIVTPINYNVYSNKLDSGLSGEVFSEDNKLNPFSERDAESQQRFEFLKKYFNSNLFTMEFETLPDFSIETGDGCTVETNLFEGDKEIKKLGIIIYMEISYNGTFKEKFIVHDAEYLPKG